MGQASFFCPAIILYAWLTGTLEFSPPAMWGGVAGAVILIGFYNYSRSLRFGSVSVIAPVFRLNFIITAALAIGFLHEKVTVQKLIAFCLALATRWLLLGGSSRADSVEPQAARRPSFRYSLPRLPRRRGISVTSLACSAVRHRRPCWSLRRPCSAA